MKKLMLLAVVALLPVLAYSSGGKHNYKPEGGYVPDAETAIRIAVAVWEPIYGKEDVAEEKPYEAVLKDGVWYVSGSLPPAKNPGEVIVNALGSGLALQHSPRNLWGQVFTFSVFIK